MAILDPQYSTRNSSSTAPVCVDSGALRVVAHAVIIPEMPGKYIIRRWFGREQPKTKEEGSHH